MQIFATYEATQPKEDYTMKRKLKLVRTEGAKKVNTLIKGKLKLSKPDVPVKQPRTAPTPRIEHSLKAGYRGPSPVVVKNRSRTAVAVDEFGTKPEYVLTARSEALLKALRQQFGKKPFARGNIDAGCLKHLGWKGILAHVGGDPASETAQFRLVK